MTRTRSLKAVVIDDEPVVLSCVSIMLKRRGYEVQSCVSPTDFFDSHSNACPCAMFPDCPDLIISDLDMPAMSGVDLLEGVLKRECRCRHIALISGKKMKTGDLIRMDKAGARYFTKPIELVPFYTWLDRVEIDLSSDITSVHST